MRDILQFDIEEDEVPVFNQDVNEHLQNMEACLLLLERGETDDAATRETLNAAFRAAHTLKAIAATVGHHSMADLTHTVETLFDVMRAGKMMPTPVVIDELLAALDTLRVLRDEVTTGQPSGIDVPALLVWLNAIIEQTLAQVENQAVETAGEKFPAQRALTNEERMQLAADALNYTLFEIKLCTAPKTFAPGARLLQATMGLMEIGHIVVQNPPQSEIVNDPCKGCLWLILATEAKAEDIQAILEEVADLDGCHVELYGEEPRAAKEWKAAGGDSPSPPDVKEPEAIAPTLIEEPRRATLEDMNRFAPESTVRIGVERLDTLMNLVGELVTNRTRLTQIESVLREKYGKSDVINSLNELASDMGRVVDQLQEEVMQARMLPLVHLFNKFPRTVRDLARAADKEVDLLIEGASTELDRSIIDLIGDPLLHLLRNAVDHGIESPTVRAAAGKSTQGMIRLSAAHQEGHIVITVQDDGRGIDPDRIREVAVRRGVTTEEAAAKLTNEEAIALIFRSNFSTADQVTEVSGRGVGLDVVNTNIKRLGGNVTVESVVGAGTTFRLTVPLTLAILQTMLVYVGKDIYAIPLTGIIESLYLGDWKISNVKNNPVIYWRDQALPLLHLRKFFQLNDPGPRQDVRPAIVTVFLGKQRVGLVVDGLIGKQEIVIKSLSNLVGNVPGVSGCTILGDGQVALIVDIPGLIGAALQSRR
ncbi:MAG: chemotaxis protein CheA [Anaerolineae bacterium]|nr:chemotaxis protein CheA [Anaerolineae bacterium]